MTDERLRVIDEGLLIAVGAPPTSPDPDVLARLDVLESDVAELEIDVTGLESVAMLSGTGSPEGVVLAPVGTVYQRTDGGTMATLYVKETGAATSSGWVPSSAAYPDIQLFTAAGTWVRPPFAKTVFVRVLAGGGGGGSGRRGASGTVCGGGGGGAGAVIIEKTFRASDLTPTAVIGVGGGGAGGLAVTTNDTNGNPGSGGSVSTFGVFILGAAGPGGAGGAVAGGTGGVSGITVTATTSLGAGGAGGAGAVGSSVNNAILTSQGGPGGGGISATPAAFNGGPGATAKDAWDAVPGAAGVVDGALPTAGTLSAAICSAGQSAGGGAASITTAAQAGGASLGRGAGGGGGGASLNGFNSGAGGNGASGAVLVITYF